jgi:stage III sporulation protein AG
MRDKKALTERGKKLWGALGRYKYVLLVLAAGVVLLLLPSGKDREETSVQPAAQGSEDFSVEALEEKLSDTLSQIDGAGQVQVLLTVESGMRRVLAQDTSVDESSVQRETETVVISTGSGIQEAVLVQQIYPKFQGALVVAEGGGDPAVQLKLTQAVAALTGLGADKISICKGK